ncbi:bifunctional RNase H/acid phosphatase [Streptomyces jeddahensis]|uniref:Phosphoserine phosphatase 1 n=1 Tax=Streptomyces jeddahensis TaxID=1716141 RepID=A0A177HR50_9ACTN|nr:bifunctional RNase H/acid phosphatase [Streptomyces jeddahensis]OAH12917.1 phosphoserine phosphatase 1 [Streptomyces jeddahensis]
MREFIVEADGGSRGNPGPAGYGAVVKDAATGETLAEAAEYIGVATNNVAEYRGLLAGLRAAHELDPAARVRVRMDSKLVVEQMSGRWQIKHPGMRPLAAEAKTVFPPSQITFEWIPREQNKHADRLANEAMDAGRRGEQWVAAGRPGPAAPASAAPASAGPASVGPAPAGRASAGPASAAPASAGPASVGRAPIGPAPAGQAGEAPSGQSGQAPAGSAARPAPGPGPAGLVTSGPPGDAVAAAAKARAAMAGARSRPGDGAEATAAELQRRAAVERPEQTAPETPLKPGAVEQPRGPWAAEQPEAAPSGPAKPVEPTRGTRHRPAAADLLEPGTGERRGAAASGAGPVGTAEADAGVSADARAEAEAGAKADADVRAARSVAVGTPPVGWAPPDLGAPATLVLLRHGETPLTREKRFSGSGGSDPALSDAGRAQADRVAAALAARGTIQAVVSSPLRRCRETADIVATRLGLEVSIEDGLRETDFGAWEGMTFAEVRDRYPDDLNAWLASAKAAPTGGESFAAVTRRVAATRDKLITAYRGRTVLLVTHVTPVKTLVRLALGAPPESLFRMELSAASLSAIAYYADGNASVRLLNDTGHLR